MSSALSHCSLCLKQFSFPIQYDTTASYARPSPTPHLPHLLPVLESGVLPLPGGRGHVGPTIPVSDLMTEDKEPGVIPRLRQGH